MLSASLFTFALVATRAFAAPYVVTNYIQISVYTEGTGYTETETAYTETVDGYTYTESGYAETELPVLETYTISVVPASPVSAITTLTSADSFAEVTYVNIVVASGKAITYDDYYTDTGYLATESVVPITYHAAPTCTGHSWSYTTNVPIFLPAGITFAPASVTTSTTTLSYPYKPASTTSEVIAVLNPADISAEDLASASIEYAPFGIDYCYTPTTVCATPATTTGNAAVCTTTFAESGDSYSDPSYDDPFDDAYNSWYRRYILIAVLVPVGWAIFWFCIGLWESWESFKGLMLGRNRKRGVPYAWACISLLCLCCTGPRYKAKSEEEKATLVEKWNGMSAWQKFKLWIKWGFLWKYPTEVLGEEPVLARKALVQRFV